MFKYTESYLKLDDVRIHYYRSGGGKAPIILLHGATDNGLGLVPLKDEITGSNPVSATNTLPI